MDFLVRRLGRDRPKELLREGSIWNGTNLDAVGDAE